MKRKIVAVLLCLVFVCSACAVSEEGEREYKVEKTESEDEEEAKEYQAKLDAISPSAYSSVDGLSLEAGSYMSVIGKSQSGEFWEEIERGALQAASDINENLGYEGKDKVKVTYNGAPDDENVDEQVSILDEELDRYPAAVAISIADTQACEVQFDLATENGIPIVAFDSGSDYKGLMAMVSTDNDAAAREAALHMSELLGDQEEVVIIANDSQSESVQTRENSFKDEMENTYPKNSVTGVYELNELKKQIAEEVNAGTYRLDGEEATGEALAEEDKIKEDDVTQENMIDYILRKHPNVKGCYATNGETALAVTDGLERMKMTDVAVIGYDLGSDEKKALEDGKISGMIVQNPYGMGYASVIAAARASLDMGNEAQIDTGYVWVTKDNLADESVQKMLY